MSYPVNPRIDLAFKRIFGVEQNKDLTISLINSIISEPDQVKDITLLNPYNPRHFYEDKLSILDIKAQGCNGRLFNIEVQITDEADYDKRALYYWAKLYTDQLKKGDDYGKLEKTIGIHILNIPSIFDTKKYHNKFTLKEAVEDFEFFKDIELHTIELSKFVESHPEEDLQAFVKKIQSALDIWSAFLTKYDLMNPEQLPVPMNTPELKKALEVLEHINMQPEEREAYESRLKWYRIQKNSLKKQFEDGIAIGKAEGLVEGEVKGQEKEKLVIASKLMAHGMAIEDIVKISGLTHQQVHELAAQKV